MRRREGGFSLIELLVVVAIILVIAAMAIPSYMRSRMRANEASAVASLKVINTAQIAYSATYPTVGFADELVKLGPPGSGFGDSTAAGLVDAVLGCPSQPCTKHGYNFAIAASSSSSFQVTAVPQVVGSTGNRGFCSDQLSKIMVDPSGGTSCTQVLQ